MATRAEILSFEMSKIIKFNCLLCGGPLSNKGFIKASDLLTNVNGEFIYYLCENCQSYIQYPQPTQEFLNNCYNNQDLGYHTPGKIQRKFIKLNAIENRITTFIDFKNKRKNTIKLNPKKLAPASVLEIGASYGQRLNILKEQGYIIEGIELSEKSVRIAKKKYNIDLINSNFENIDFQKKKFDIVILSMVLEHIKSPKKIIDKIYNLMNIDGELLISVPVSDGFEFKKFKKYCYTLQPPYHIYIPSNRGIELLLADKFKIVDKEFHYFHRDFVASSEFLLRDKRSIFAKFFAIQGKHKWLQPLFRIILFLLTGLKILKTSRVSIRAVKK